MRNLLKDTDGAKQISVLSPYSYIPTATDVYLG